MTEGTYQFTIVNGGWALQKQIFKFTVDNSGNNFNFNCVVNGTPQTIAAGRSQPGTSLYPALASYDDGQNNAKQAWLNYGGRKVVVTPQGSIDLVRP